MVPLTAPPQAIETTADPAALRAMIAKTAAAWEAVGETAPHDSVLTCEEYRPERFAENEISFFESAREDLGLLSGLLRRIGRSPEGFACCLEFGCGVGRVTAQLAADVLKGASPGCLPSAFATGTETFGGARLYQCQLSAGNT